MLASVLKAPVFFLAIWLRDDSQANPHFNVYFEHFSDRIESCRKTREQSLKAKSFNNTQTDFKHYTLESTASVVQLFNFWTLSKHHDEKNPNSITFGCPNANLAIEDVVAISQGAKSLDEHQWRVPSKNHSRCSILERLLKEEGVIYGVTTGYGDSCTVAIPPSGKWTASSPSFHGCGLGGCYLTNNHVPY